MKSFLETVLTQTCFMCSSTVIYVTPHISVAVKIGYRISLELTQNFVDLFRVAVAYFSLIFYYQIFSIMHVCYRININIYNLTKNVGNIPVHLCKFHIADIFPKQRNGEKFDSFLSWFLCYFIWVCSGYIMVAVIHFLPELYHHRMMIPSDCHRGDSMTTPSLVKYAHSDNTYYSSWACQVGLVLFDLQQEWKNSTLYFNFLNWYATEKKVYP